MAFQFQGVRVYIDQAADDAGLVASDADTDQRRSDVNIYRAKAREGPLVKTIVDALSQLPGQVDRAKAGLIDRDSPRDAMDRVKLVRDALAIQLAGVDAAIADVEKNLDVDVKTVGAGDKAPASGDVGRKDRIARPTDVTNVDPDANVDAKPVGGDADVDFHPADADGDGKIEAVEKRPTDDETAKPAPKPTQPVSIKTQADEKAKGKK